VYIALLLTLGVVFGPTIVELIHIPHLWLRLLWLLALAVGLPLLLAWLASRSRAPQPVRPSPRKVFGAMLLASFAGTTALAAAWATASTAAQLLGITRPLNVTYTLAGWLLGRGLRATSAYTLIYSGLLLLCVAVGAAYDTFVLPRLAPRGTTRLRQALGLALLGMTLVVIAFAPALALRRGSPLAAWWQAGGPPLLLALALGMLSYAVTTVYGRALALAVLPSQRTSPVDTTTASSVSRMGAESPAPTAPPTRAAKTTRADDLDHQQAR
jgi:hypothetical protein